MIAETFLAKVGCAKLKRCWRDYLEQLCDWSDPAGIAAELGRIADAAAVDRSGFPIEGLLRRAITQAKEQAKMPTKTEALPAEPQPVVVPTEGQDFRDDFYRAADAIPAEPTWSRDRGIIIAAGGWRFFPSLYVTVGMIRRTGCQLPIQVWYLGDRGEYHPLMGELLEPWGVEWIDADQYVRDNPGWAMPRLGGWELKALATAACDFREVVSFDADAYPLYDPARLLDSVPFIRNGAMFWADQSSDSKAGMKPNQWSTFGVPPRDGPAWESGQFAVDKSRHWRAMWLAWWLNTRSGFVYQHIHGDKDTFNVAFRKLQHRVWVSRRPHWRKVAFVQFDHQGKAFTVHRCRGKFTFPWLDARFTTPQNVRNGKVPTLPGESEAHQLLAQCLSLCPREKIEPLLPMGLLIVGAARSMTTEVYGYCRRALTLLPCNVHAGEVLNSEHNKNATRRHYTEEQSEWPALWKILDNHRGEVIKEISQPAATIAYVRAHPGRWKVLYVHRRAEEIQARQLDRWGPQKPQPHPREWEDQYLAVADETVFYDQLIWDADHLWSALERMGFRPATFDYIDEAFQRRRDEALKRFAV